MDIQILQWAIDTIKRADELLAYNPRVDLSRERMAWAGKDRAVWQDRLDELEELKEKLKKD